MTSPWHGRLYALPQEDGSHLVGITLPPGGHHDGSFRVFVGSGPFLPTGFPEMLRVEDLERWLAEMNRKGYEFTPTTMRELEGF